VASTSSTATAASVGALFMLKHTDFIEFGGVVHARINGGCPELTLGRVRVVWPTVRRRP
jgi:hypothetical protein